MATRKILTNIDLNQNELQNLVIENLADTPESPVEGQVWYNTEDSYLYIYDGTNAVKVGYLPIATAEVLGGVKEGSNVSIDSNGVLSVADASTSTKGVIEIATDTEASTGTSEVLAVNPKQLATKVTANGAITGATKCKITYDSKGLVTAGADLQASDIPSLTLSKISDVTASASEVNVLDGITATTAELNILDGVTANASELNILDGATLTTTELNYVDGVTSSIQDQLDGKVDENAAITASTSGKTVITYDAKGLVTGGSEIGIDSGSTNYLEFDTTNHNIKAKVDTTVTADSTKLVTSGAVKTAINAAVSSGVRYEGTWDITSATDYSGIALPVSKGALYYVTGTGPKTIGGIEWNAGDYLLVNTDVASGGSLVGKVDKLDNTESADIVRINATQTLTNKTIDADDNTISDLTTSNLKSGVLQTTVRASSSASDSSIPSEKAVATAVEAKQNEIAAGIQYDMVAYSGTAGTVSTVSRQTTVRAAASASDTAYASEKAIRTELDKKQDQVLAGTQYDMVTYSGTKGTFDTVSRQTTVRASSSASDTAYATEKAVATAVEGRTSKTTAVNADLVPTSGVATWEITHSYGTYVIVSVKEVATGEEVIASVKQANNKVTISFNADTTIAASTYKAVIIG